jgi:hypothetical protein
MKTKIIVIETAFLHNDLKKRIFMELPGCMELGNGKCLVLTKITYRFVQSSRQILVKFFETLKSCVFTGGLVDPCLWVKKSNSGIVMLATYADDFLTIGSDESIKKVIEDLKIS